MSRRLQALERERRLLVARSSLARLRLRGDAQQLRRPFRLGPLVLASSFLLLLRLAR